MLMTASLKQCQRKFNRWHSPVVKASVVLLVASRFCVGMGADNVDKFDYRKQKKCQSRVRSVDAEQRVNEG